MDDKPALTGLLAGDHVEPKRRSYIMDTEDFNLTETTEDLVTAILNDHERDLCDDELLEV